MSARGGPDGARLRLLRGAAAPPSRSPPSPQHPWPGAPGVGAARVSTPLRLRLGPGVQDPRTRARTGALGRASRLLAARPRGEPGLWDAAAQGLAPGARPRAGRAAPASEGPSAGSRRPPGPPSAESADASKERTRTPRCGCSLKPRLYQGARRSSRHATAQRAGRPSPPAGSSGPGVTDKGLSPPKRLLLGAPKGPPLPPVPSSRLAPLLPPRTGGIPRPPRPPPTPGGGKAFYLCQSGW